MTIPETVMNSQGENPNLVVVSDDEDDESMRKHDQNHYQNWRLQALVTYQQWLEEQIRQKAIMNLWHCSNPCSHCSLLRNRLLHCTILNAIVPTYSSTTMALPVTGMEVRENHRRSGIVRGDFQANASTDAHAYYLPGRLDFLANAAAYVPIRRRGNNVLQGSDQGAGSGSFCHPREIWHQPINRKVEELDLTLKL